MIERKHRIEDALEAVKSAQQEGVVAGGGVALLRAAENLNIILDNEEQSLGLEIIKGEENNVINNIFDFHHDF